MSSSRRTTTSAPPRRQVVALVVFAVLAFVTPVRNAAFGVAESLGQKYGEHEGRVLQKNADDVTRAAKESQAQQAASAAPAAPAGG